jgi:hypothetical protein
VNYGGAIWRNSNYGVGSWTSQTTSKFWSSICSNSDGTKLAATVYGGNIWTFAPFYTITMYGKSNDLIDVFESGTTTGTSNFKQGGSDFNTLFNAYSSGYKGYFTQDFFGNTTTIPSSFPYTSAGAGLIPKYNLNPEFFFRVTGNDASFATVPTSYNYGFRFIASGGTIIFNTDTVVNLWMVGGGGGGGVNVFGRGAGGGGAGTVMNFNFPMENGIPYSFTIGGGGDGKTTSYGIGDSGLPTQMSWTINTTSYRIDASGGGGGGGYNNNNGSSFGTTGGSGGGSGGTTYIGAAANARINVIGSPISYSYTNNIISGPGTNNIPTIGSFSGTFTDNTTTNTSSISLDTYANKGGDTSSAGGGAGGGGAGVAGTDSTDSNGTAGGNGVTITGTAVVVGGGGGGGSGSGSSTGGSGGTGGGGAGSGNGEGGTAGTANTGGGGGGSDNTAGNGGNGGSGVVYLFF